MDPTKIGTCPRLVVTLAVCALVTASSETFSAQPRASGKPVRGTVSRYPQAVTPVKEDVAAVVDRGRRRGTGNLPSGQSLMSLSAVSPGPDREFDTIP
jgi:hypothetical protein